jgi:hypothetical protein
MNIELPVQMTVATQIEAVPAYEGAYSVTPSNEQQTLETNGKKMTEDVTVAAMPSGSVTVPELKIGSPTLGVTFNNNTGMAHVSSGSKSAQITAQIENGYVDTNSVSLGQAYYLPNTFDQKITTSTLKPENIKKGVVILGVTGTYEV